VSCSLRSVTTSKCKALYCELLFGLGLLVNQKAPFLIDLKEFDVSLSSAEGIVAGNLGEMTGVIDRKYANVSRAAKFEAIDAAIGCDDPRRLFGSSVNRSHQMKCQKADRAGMREYRYSLTGML